MHAEGPLFLVERPLKAIGPRLFATTFAESSEFDERWWIRIVRGTDHGSLHYSAMVGNTEVARVELLERHTLNPDFRDVPRSAEGYLEIAFLEVAESRRGQGIGTAVVQQIVRSVDRSFAAYSEGADRFWESLGWPRYVHSTDSQLFRPLYVLTR